MHINNYFSDMAGKYIKLINIQLSKIKITHKNSNYYF